MGGFIRVQATPVDGPTKTYNCLRLHPNFTFPPTPEDFQLETIAAYVVDAVANLVSPPKETGEHNEFACEDIADAIRSEFKKELIAHMHAETKGLKGVNTTSRRTRGMR